jgi:hypothetical protein
LAGLGRLQPVSLFNSEALDISSKNIKVATHIILTADR